MEQFKRHYETANSEERSFQKICMPSRMLEKPQETKFFSCAQPLPEVRDRRKRADHGATIVVAHPVEQVLAAEPRTPPVGMLIQQAADQPDIRAADFPALPGHDACHGTQGTTGAPDESSPKNEFFLLSSGGRFPIFQLLVALMVGLPEW